MESEYVPRKVNFSGVLSVGDRWHLGGVGMREKWLENRMEELRGEEGGGVELRSIVKEKK